MLRNIFLVSLLVYAVCAAHWDVREVDSAEDQDEEISADGIPTFVKCLICNKIVKKVKKKLSNKPTVVEIKTKLNKACYILTFKKKKAECKNLVEKYMDKLIDELMTKDGPKTICTKIFGCNIKEVIFVHDQAHDNF
uniref:NK-lysin tandem duplicate 1 n=1 Tax=Cyprinus carpio TaxID=7962 RepID=A0A8C1MD38_CYPCA